MMTNDTTANDEATLSEISTEGITDLIHDVTLDGPDGETLTLPETIEDLARSHEELDSYKRGALTMCGVIDERLLQAKEEGDQALEAVLRETKRTAFGVYLRVQRGDEELLGSRDGKYNGYFDAPGDPIEETEE